MIYQVGNTEGFECPCCNETHAYLHELSLDQAAVAEHIAEGCVLRHKFDPATMNLEGTLTPEQAEAELQAMLNPPMG